MASYTGHGHHIPGTPEKTQPAQRKLCGGPGICLPCSTDAIRAYDGANMLFSNPAGVVQQKVNPLMTDTSSAIPSAPKDGVFNKAVNAIHDLGHDMAAAEAVVVKLLRSGIVLRDVNAADHDVHEVQSVVDEAAPVLEAAEPTLAGEVKQVQTVTDATAEDTDKADADATEFINEVNQTLATNQPLATSPAPVRSE
jgi:hypothetical protein